MRTIFRAACLFAAATLVTACAASQSTNVALPAQQSAARRAGHAPGGDLIYTGVKHAVQIFTYPDGSADGSFTIAGAVRAMCSDSSGNVFVGAETKTAGGNGGAVYEFAHGGTSPISTLAVPAHSVPMACSSDPTTGNLAVTYQDLKNFEPSVGVYAGASGSPAIYKSDDIGAEPQCAYDDAGNLLATSGGNVGAIIASGSSKFAKVTFDRLLGGVKHVQWDGSDFALQSFRPNHHNGDRLLEKVFRLQISGSKGSVVGISEFKNWPTKVSGSSWIDGGTIIGTPYAQIAFWNYPNGGKATKVVKVSEHMAAVTISVGQ